MTTALKKCKKCTVVSRQLQVQKLVGWFARCCVGLVCRGESDGGLSGGLGSESDEPLSEATEEGNGTKAKHGKRGWWVARDLRGRDLRVTNRS